MADEAPAAWEKIPPAAPPTSPQVPAAPRPATTSPAAQVWEKIAPPTTAPAKPPTDWGHALWEGIKRGASEIVEGGAQIGARMQAAGPEEGAGAFDVPAQRQALPGRVDEAVRQSAQAYAQDPAVRAHPIVAGGGRIGGNIAATAPLMALPGMGAMPGIGLSGPARAAAGVLARGALGGGTGAAMQPVVPQAQQRQPSGIPSGPTAAPPAAIPAQDYWSEKIKQVGIGAGVGAAIPGVGGVLSRRLPSPQAVQALPAGIQRAFRPIYDFLVGSEERTNEGFARTIARQVLDPIGGRVDRRISGWDLNENVEKQISDAYDRVLPNITVTPQALTTPGAGVTNAMAALNTDEAKTYQKILDVAYPKDTATRAAPLTGQEFREARTKIAQQGYKWLGTNKSDIGEALIAHAKQMTDVVATENPQFAAPLKAAGEAYKMWMRMAAAGSQATKGGKFSPADFLRATRSQEPSATGFATGDSVLQGYAQAAFRAMGGDRSLSVIDLMHIFAHRGLPMQIGGAMISPLARAAKTATPAISPGAGAVGARELTPQRRVERRIPEAPYVGPAGT